MQVLPEPIGIIDCAAACPASAEQGPTRLCDGTAASAEQGDRLELKSVECVYLCDVCLR